MNHSVMRALSNPKHERFAQEVVNGASASEAYKRAGYRPNRGDASILRNRPTIIRRIADLQDFNQEVAGKLAATQEVARSRAIERVVERFALSRAWVLERLRENVERAMQARPVFDSDGRETGEYRYNGMVANRALELLGKELGMFVDKKERRIGFDKQLLAALLKNA